MVQNWQEKTEEASGRPPEDEKSREYESSWARRDQRRYRPEFSMTYESIHFQGVA